LTLLNSYTGTPPFFPDTHPGVVVKVTDLCPLSEGGWCSGTESKTNPYVFVNSFIAFVIVFMGGDHRSGQYLNFDLAYPSSAIPDDFFPSDEELYGYKVRSFPHLVGRDFLTCLSPRSRISVSGTSLMYPSRAKSGEAGETKLPKAAHQI